MKKAFFCGRQVVAILLVDFWNDCTIIWRNRDPHYLFSTTSLIGPVLVRLRTSLRVSHLSGTRERRKKNVVTGTRRGCFNFHFRHFTSSLFHFFIFHHPLLFTCWTKVEQANSHRTFLSLSLVSDPLSQAPVTNYKVSVDRQYTVDKKGNLMPLRLRSGKESRIEVRQSNSRRKIKARLQTPKPLRSSQVLFF